MSDSGLATDSDSVGLPPRPQKNLLPPLPRPQSRVPSQRLLPIHDDESDPGSEDELDTSDGPNDAQEPRRSGGTKRILLQRFTVYNSNLTMYIVGSNAKETLFRILEIQRDREDGIVDIVEERNYFYTRKDMVELLNSLDELIEGGIHKIAQGYGLLGLIRFTAHYYLCIVTKCSQVAIIGGHYVYHMDDTRLIPLNIAYRRPEKYSDEEKLLSIFKYLDLGKTFYFSYGYDITNLLQTNITRSKAGEPPRANNRFVWNRTLLEPILDYTLDQLTTYEWFQPIIHGFIDQALIAVTGRKFYILLIARRSHHYAGARFLKRGCNLAGDVANEIETEQIVSDMLTTSFHDAHGLFHSPRWTLYVQHRGLIPLFWTQDMNKLPKPPIEISLLDPYYLALARHFNNLFARYGTPIIVLNLIKTSKEKTPRELKLNGHFVSCITYLNQFLPPEHRIRYHGFDMLRHLKRNLDVIRPIQQFALAAIDETGFFHNGHHNQRGVIRTNCIDCLDRTNAAQFIIGKEVLLHQLRALLYIKDPSEPAPFNTTNITNLAGYTQLEYDLDAVNILTEMFHDHGDTIAIQYGGSNLVNTMDSYRRINQWSSHTRDVLNLVKRIYLNSFMDLIRQEAINLFLGNYLYAVDKPKLWELETDFSLHNNLAIDDVRTQVSYQHWYNANFFGSPVVRLVGPRSGELYDNWFNECYKAKKFQLFTEVFQFTMNLTARYFGMSDEDWNPHLSPFQSRKRAPQPAPKQPVIDEDEEQKKGEESQALEFDVSATNDHFYRAQFDFSKLCEPPSGVLFPLGLPTLSTADKEVYSYYLTAAFQNHPQALTLFAQYVGVEWNPLEINAEDDYFR